MRAFLLAYLAILLTPGPNLLVIAGVAALHGLRGAVPICLGIALGAGTLNAALAATLGTAQLASDVTTVGRLLSAVLLFWVAFSVARSRPPDAARAARRAQGAEFSAGFCTAITNPVTAAFFAAQFLGPLGAVEAMRPLVPLVVVGMALLVSLGFASLLAHPACQRAALAWHRPIRLGAAFTLVLMATSILASLVA